MYLFQKRGRGLVSLTVVLSLFFGTPLYGSNKARDRKISPNSIFQNTDIEASKWELEYQNKSKASLEFVSYPTGKKLGPVKSWLRNQLRKIQAEKKRNPNVVSGLVVLNLSGRENFPFDPDVIGEAEKFGSSEENIYREMVPDSLAQRIKNKFSYFYSHNEPLRTTLTLVKLVNGFGLTIYTLTAIGAPMSIAAMAGVGIATMSAGYEFFNTRLRDWILKGESNTVRHLRNYAQDFPSYIVAKGLYGWAGAPTVWTLGGFFSEVFMASLYGLWGAAGWKMGLAVRSEKELYELDKLNLSMDEYEKGINRINNRYRLTKFATGTMATMGSIFSLSGQIKLATVWSGVVGAAGAAYYLWEIKGHRSTRARAFCRKLIIAN